MDEDESGEDVELHDSLLVVILAFGQLNQAVDGVDEGGGLELVVVEEDVIQDEQESGDGG